MTEQIVEHLLKYGQEITFSFVLVLVLIGGFKIVVFLLKMLKSKDQDVQQLTAQIEVFNNNLGKLAGLFDKLIGQKPASGGPKV